MCQYVVRVGQHQDCPGQQFEGSSKYPFPHINKDTEKVVQKQNWRQDLPSRPDLITWTEERLPTARPHPTAKPLLNASGARQSLMLAPTKDGAHR